MVYKKYIKKGDKLYGPYYYHSRREGGKVVSEYHGPGRKFNYKKFIWIFVGVFLVVALIYGLAFFEKGITGKAILNLDADYQEGEPLEGNLKLILREGELIPTSSKIIFETSNQTYNYSLDQIVSEDSTEGNFYISGKTLSGSGAGYGAQGIIDELYPTIYFTLNILSSFSEENQTQDNQTAQMTLEIETSVDGKVSVGNDFVYNLTEAETIEIVSGSVHTDAERLSNDMITLDVAGGQAIITTSYSEIRYGFGEDYLGKDKKKIDIDLSTLNMTFEQGELKVSLVYNAEELISMTTFLETGEVITETPISEEPEEEVVPEEIQNIIPIIENETKVNLTTEPNVTIETIEAILTDEEKAILTGEFGNVSVEITEARVKKNKIEIRYEFEDYWFEASYDASLSQEDLEAQMETDKIKWLKDIVKSLTKEEPPAEEIEEFLGNCSIE